MSIATSKSKHCPDCEITCPWCGSARWEIRARGCGSATDDQQWRACRKSRRLRGVTCPTCGGGTSEEDLVAVKASLAAVE